jgi:hypothetical protein
LIPASSRDENALESRPEATLAKEGIMKFSLEEIQLEYPEVDGDLVKVEFVAPEVPAATAYSTDYDEAWLDQFATE